MDGDTKKQSLIHQEYASHPPESSSSSSSSWPISCYKPLLAYRRSPDNISTVDCFYRLKLFLNLRSIQFKCVLFIRQPIHSLPVFINQSGGCLTASLARPRSLTRRSYQSHRNHQASINNLPYEWWWVWSNNTFHSLLIYDYQQYGTPQSPPSADQHFLNISSSSTTSTPANLSPNQLIRLSIH